MASSDDSKQHILMLLRNLCDHLAGPGNEKTFNRVARFIAQCPYTIGSQMPYDEITLVSKISNHISSVVSSQNDVTRFMNSHEQLKACQKDSNLRIAILTFLLYVSEAKHEKKSRESIVDTFSGNYTRNEAYHSLNLKSNFFSNMAFTDPSKFEKYFASKETRQKMLAKIVNPVPAAPSTAKWETFVSKKVHHGTVEIPNKQNQEEIIDVPKDMSKDVIQNALSVCSGMQGIYLKKDIVSGKFKLNPATVKSLNIQQAGQLLRISELGYYHNKMKSFTDPKSGYCALGLMGQGFISALQREETNYYGKLASMQDQVNEVNGRNNNRRSQTNVTLTRVLVWTEDWLERLQWLTTIAEACQEKKGGALASTVYQFFSIGDPKAKVLVRELLVHICRPLLQMVSQWVLDGTIFDPHEEFFIECLSEVPQDRFWYDKYRVRTSMLPLFISTEVANKILVTGKSINFLREVCQDRTSISGKEDLKNCFKNNPEDIFSKSADTKFHTMIDNIYLKTSKIVLDIIIGRYKLIEHLQAMRRYLLLAQGDFIGTLMGNLKTELDRPGKELYCYDIASIMDAAIRSSNAQYDDPEILNQLDLRLSPPIDGETGWDILSLQYSVRGPLGTVLEPSMHTYQTLFKPLWRMKHIEFVLSSKIWRDQISNSKPLRKMETELRPLMYRLHLYTSEIIHFINQMEYYVLYEVIECSWTLLVEKISQAKTLDDILEAHNEFLETVKVGAFLDSNSQLLSHTMEEVFSGITKLEMWQDKFFELCFKELDARKSFEAEIQASEAKGKYGVTAEKRLERDQEKKLFHQGLISCQNSLEKIVCDYEIAVRQFILMLNSNNENSLQLFGTRLDFNEYYKKRDQRLSVPLTFEHMRMSNIYNKSNASMNNSKYSVN